MKRRSKFLSPSFWAIPNLGIQEDLVLPYFPPATPWHYVEASLGMQWTLQITLLNPHGLEIQRKPSREGSVWPLGRMSRKCRARALLPLTAATDRPGSILLPAQLPLTSSHIPLDSFIASLITESLVSFEAAKCHSGTAGPGNNLPVLAIETVCQGYRVWGAQDWAADVLLQSLFPKTPKYLSGNSLSNLHSNKPPRKTFFMLQRCAWKLHKYVCPASVQTEVLSPRGKSRTFSLKTDDPDIQNPSLKEQKVSPDSRLVPCPLPWSLVSELCTCWECLQCKPAQNKDFPELIR